MLEKEWVLLRTQLSDKILDLQRKMNKHCSTQFIFTSKSQVLPPSINTFLYNTIIIKRLKAIDKSRNWERKFADTYQGRRKVWGWEERWVGSNRKSRRSRKEESWERRVLSTWPIASFNPLEAGVWSFGSSTVNNTKGWVGNLLVLEPPNSGSLTLKYLEVRMKQPKKKKFIRLFFCEIFD